MRLASIKTVTDLVYADGYTIFDEAIGVAPQMVEKVNYHVIAGKYIAGGDVIIGVFDTRPEAEAHARNLGYGF